MANKIYPLNKGKMLAGFVGGTAINLLADNIKVSLIDTGAYTYDDLHDHYDDVPGGAVIAVSPNLSGKTISAAGAFDSADPIFPTVTGVSIEAFIIWKDTATPSTSPLIYYQDTSIVGAPYTPVGNDVRITVNSGGYFKI